MDLQYSRCSRNLLGTYSKFKYLDQKKLYAIKEKKKALPVQGQEIPFSDIELPRTSLKKHNGLLGVSKFGAKSDGNKRWQS